MELLVAQHVGFAYGQAPVLRDVNLVLRAGEVVALLGPNGSGKSTLIRSLLGQLPAQGSIAWDGKPIAKWSRRQLARQVAYMPQSPAWEPEQTVADVLRLGRTPYLGAFGIESTRDLSVISEVANLLKLSDLLDRRLDTLSGGQRQRVILGRCLAQEPRAMLLDEPGTHLDLRHQVDLGNLLRSFARNRNLGVLMASHELNLAGQLADRLILLSQGAVVADGPPEQVLKPELLSSVYELPMRQISQDGQVYVMPVVDRITTDSHPST